MESDAELAARVRSGEVAAFRALYARYHERVYRFLARLSGDRVAAEDLLQETWAAFARAAPRLEPTESVAPLLFTIARNKFKNWRRWALLDLSRLDGLRREPEASTVDAGDAREQLRAIERALATLPVAAREVLLLVAVEGLEPKEAAGVLGIEPEATRQRLARARAQLVQALERHGSPAARLAVSIQGEGR